MLIPNQPNRMELKHRLGDNGLTHGLTSCARVSDLRHGTIAQALAIRAAAEKAAVEEKRGRGKAAKRDSARPSFFPQQEHFSAPMGGGSASALSPVHVQDGGVLKALQACLEGTDVGWRGRNQRPQKYYDGPYNKLVLKEAWRVENAALWQSYQGKRSGVMGLQDWTKEHMGQQIRPELYRSSGELPGELVQSCNEVR